MMFLVKLRLLFVLYQPADFCASVLLCYRIGLCLCVLAPLGYISVCIVPMLCPGLMIELLPN